MYKIILIFLFGIAVGASFFLLPKFFKNNISPRNLQEEAQYKRKDNQTIKGTFDPGYTTNILDNNIRGLTSTGFNTIYVYVNYEYDNEQMKLTSPFGKGDFSEKAKDENINLIKKAHDKGFAVHLALEFGGGHNKPLGVPLKQFLEDTKKQALVWAKIAEDYQVESFAPASEIDFHINKEYFTNDNKSADRVVQITNTFHQEILPEIKKVFSGKTVYQHASYFNNNINAKGYDLIGVDFGPAGRDLEEFRTYTKEILNAVSQTAIASQTEWFISEFGVQYKALQKDSPPGGEIMKNSKAESYDELQDEYYQIFTEEYLNFQGGKKPKGLDIFSYVHPIANVYNRPAEKVLKEFFAKIT